MKKEFLILILVIAFFAGCIGEAPQETAAPTTSAPVIRETGYANPDAAVDAEWVEAHLDNANVKIIATPILKDSYDEGHISGALYVDYKTDIVDLDATVENQMASKEKVEELIRRLGLKNSDTSIVYDNTNNMIAARMFNVLKLYGHDDVRLLNGGKNAWTTAGGGLTIDVPEVTPSDYTAKDKSSAEYVSLEYVYNNLNNPGIQIVDVRPTDQYTGENIRPGIGRDGGHIAGAINAPGGATWNDDKTLKSYEELVAFYEEAGVSMDKKIVVYCHNGMLSSYSWFVLTQLVGYSNVAIYDGSSLEWTNHPNTPLVTGPEPGEVPTDLKPLPDGEGLWTYIGTGSPYEDWDLWPGTTEFYNGTAPHGALLTTYVNNEARDAIESISGSMPIGAIIVKENYMPDKTLAAITVMYKIQGHDPENNDWFWAKYKPGGEIEAEGKVAGCIGCHGAEKDNDYVFTSALK